MKDPSDFIFCACKIVSSAFAFNLIDLGMRALLALEFVVGLALGMAEVVGLALGQLLGLWLCVCVGLTDGLGLGIGHTGLVSAL